MILPIGVRILTKVKFNDDKIEKIIKRNKESGLKLTQPINALRTCMLSTLDYYLMNSIFSIVELDKLDRFIRKIIN
jgi:hypothetical protein